MVRPMLFLALAFLLFAAACTPVTGSARVATTPAEAYDCAAATLSSLGYRIVDLDESARTIRAERQKNPAGARLYGIAYDRVVVTVDAAASKLSVVGRTDMESGSRGPLPSTSRELRDDAKTLLARCGG